THGHTHTHTLGTDAAVDPKSMGLDLKLLNWAATAPGTSHTRKHTHTHTHTHTHGHTNTRAELSGLFHLAEGCIGITQAFSPFLSDTHTHTQTHTLSILNSPSLSLSRSHFLKHTHTYNHTPYTHYYLF